MRSGKIEVVRYEGELLFKSPDGIMLDALEAYDLFDAEIHIIRNGQEIDRGTLCEGLLLPEFFEEGDEIHFTLSHSLEREVDFRAVYVESQISEKLTEIEDLLLDFVNDENFEQEYEAYMELFDKELAAFVFPENPIIRRRDDW